ncbi:MAG: MaoC family dehydratase [Nitrospinae bacterium]|nr:MaoC family dehydratase [Nitrospinota bacterium]
MPEFEAIRIGDEAKIAHTVTEQDVRAFADLTGDHNPLHMDGSFAARTVFKNRVVHGMFTASFIATVIGVLLPGPGALIHSLEFDFKKPVRIGDIIEAKVTVVQKVDGARMLALQTSVANQHSQVVLKGTAKVMWAQPARE